MSVSTPLRSFQVTDTTTGQSRIYDVRTPYHLTKALLEEWVNGARELYGVCQYLEALGLSIDYCDDDLDTETPHHILEELALTAQISLGLDQSHVDAFLRAITASLHVEEL